MKTPRRNQRRTGVAALMTLTAMVGASALTGCSTLETSVEIRNDSDRRILASLELDRVGDVRTLTQETIGAGSATILGPVRTPPFEPAELRVTTPGDLGTTDRTLNVPRGRSIAVVEDDAWGAVRVRLLGKNAGGGAAADAENDGAE